MIKFFTVILAATTLVLGGSSGWWEADGRQYSASKQIDLSKYPGGIIMRCGDKDRTLPDWLPTKIVITQEKPCLGIYPDNFRSYKKLDDNKAELVSISNYRGDSLSEGGESDKSDPDVLYLLGSRGCNLKGKEHWVVYQLEKNRWNKVCETTFTFK